MVLLAQESGERVKDFEAKEKVQCALHSIVSLRTGGGRGGLGLAGNPGSRLREQSEGWV